MRATLVLSALIWAGIGGTGTGASPDLPVDHARLLAGETSGPAALGRSTPVVAWLPAEADRVGRTTSASAPESPAAPRTASPRTQAAFRRAVEGHRAHAARAAHARAGRLSSPTTAPPFQRA